MENIIRVFNKYKETYLTILIITTNILHYFNPHLIQNYKNESIN